VVRNVAADHYAKRAMQGIPVELDDAHSDLSVLPNQFHRHRVHELETALTNLPAPQTEIIRLIAIDGLSYSDAATRLGVPVGTVMSRLYRARENLRRRFEDGWPLGDARSTKKAPAPAPKLAPAPAVA
jgi:RNA polymerase sigma-70 factor (ECF subfamily)